MPGPLNGKANIRSYNLANTAAIMLATAMVGGAEG